MTEDKNWVCIFKSTSKFEAEALVGNLQASGLQAVLLNKQDSSYLNFGYVEIHVPEAQKSEAIQIVQQQNDTP